MTYNKSILAEYICKINEKVKELEDNYELCTNKSHRDLLICFRGESKDFGKTSLMPSIFRNEEYLRKERHLFELLEDYRFVNDANSSVERAIEAQHYISISRMLDITFDSLIALYFACSEYKSDDGRIFVFGFPKYFSPHSEYVRNFYDNILENKHVPYYKHFKVFTSTFLNDRIAAQKGGFIFFPGSTFEKINDCYYRSIDINHSDKEEISKQLEKLFQIIKSTVFPEKNSYASEIKEKFEKNFFEQNSLNDENEIDRILEIVEYEVSFLKEEIERLRVLRKQKKDLIEYINQSKSENKNELENRVKEKIKEIEKLGRK